MGTIVITAERKFYVKESPRDRDSTIELIRYIYNINNGCFKGLHISGMSFIGVPILGAAEDCTFEHCKFQFVNFIFPAGKPKTIFKACEFLDCAGVDELIKDNTAVKLLSLKEVGVRTGGKAIALPNKKFVKVVETCAFCHNTFTTIQKRSNPKPMLKEIPNIDRRVCDWCYRNYQIETKFTNNRTYGYRGPLSFFRTPMDRANTEILGLEMEFEGDYYGWKELQDAHQGKAFYGYDSSVVGRNELSWDCGSYSYWKYLAPLAEVCSAIQNNGGRAGPSAGIHIHVSSPDTNPTEIAIAINQMAQTGIMNVLMRAISLRTDPERFDTYANLRSSAGAHHAGISASSKRTCEFRIFASSLDPKVILHRLKFCKEIYNMTANKKKPDDILMGFSKETKKFIMTCAKEQCTVNNFISQNQYEELKTKLGV